MEYVKFLASVKRKTEKYENKIKEVEANGSLRLEKSVPNFAGAGQEETDHIPIQQIIQ